ncbi:MAG: phospholipase D family protein [Planctomycetota bacterium]
MRRFFLFILIVLSGLIFLIHRPVLSRESQKTYQADLAVYFSPEGQAREAIVEEINRSEKSIKIAMYFFSDAILANALLKAKERGIDVKIVLNRENSGEKNSKRDWLEEKEIAIRYYSPEVKKRKPDDEANRDKPGKMHHKFAVIDERIVITGSFNWTYSAEKYNNENLLVIYDQELAQAYLAQWQALWDKGITHQKLLESDKSKKE